MYFDECLILRFLSFEFRALQFHRMLARWDTTVPRTLERLTFKPRALYCPRWRKCVPIVNWKYFFPKLLIYAYKNYYWIENTLKFLKPFKLCLYVKQNSQESHSPKHSVNNGKVGSTLTSSPTPFPGSYGSRNSLYQFSAMSAFKWRVHCENRTSPAPLAREIPRVPLKTGHSIVRARFGERSFPRYTNWSRFVC